MEYYYHAKKHFIATILEEDIVELKNREKNINLVPCYVALHDVMENRVFIQEHDDFTEEFIPFTEDEIPLLQEWYDLDDVIYHKLKLMFLKNLKE